MPNVKVGNYFGGLDIKKQRAELKDHTPAIVVGTPGRIKQVRSREQPGLPWLLEPRCCNGLPHGAACAGRDHTARPVCCATQRLTCRLPMLAPLQLANEKALNLMTVRHFVIDECDKVLEKLGEWTPLRRGARMRSLPVGSGV